jgi:hypothetical protein
LLLIFSQQLEMEQEAFLHWVQCLDLPAPHEINILIQAALAHPQPPQVSPPFRGLRLGIALSAYLHWDAPAYIQQLEINIHILATQMLLQQGPRLRLDKALLRATALGEYLL